MAAKKEPVFEDKMKRLQEIVASLESPDISLEQGMALYREGAECVKFCREKLASARHELEVWQNEGAAPLDLETGEAEDDSDLPF